MINTFLDEALALAPTGSPIKSSFNAQAGWLEQSSGMRQVCLFSSLFIVLNDQIPYCVGLFRESKSKTNFPGEHALEPPQKLALSALIYEIGQWLSQICVWYSLPSRPSVECDEMEYTQPLHQYFLQCYFFQSHLKLPLISLLCPSFNSNSKYFNFSNQLQIETCKHNVCT